MAVRKNRRKSAGSLKTSFYGKNKYLDKVISDNDFRLRTTSALGGGWNFIYALFHIVMAIAFRSFWFLTMGVYYLTVCGMRASALRLKPDAENKRAERKAMKRNAILTFVLDLSFPVLSASRLQKIATRFIICMLRLPWQHTHFTVLWLPF